MAGQLVEKSKNVWLVRVYMGTGAGGKRIYSNRTIHGTKKDAQTYLNGVLRAKDLGEYDAGAPKAFCGELFDLVLLDYRIHGKRIDWASIVIEKHLRPFFGEMRAAAVTSNTIKQFIANCRKAGQSNGTINRSLQFLKRAYNLGRKERPPIVRTVPEFDYLPEDASVRQGFFERDEFLAIREALPEELKALVTLAYHSGCRKGELLALEWRQVDLQRAVVSLDPAQTKTKKGRTLPLLPEPLEMLKLEKARRDTYYSHCEHVFSRDGEPIRRFDRAWLTACTQCGFVDDEGKATKLFHDFRRTGVRNLVRAGVPESIAMQISGHRTKEIFQRYDITSADDIQWAAKKLAAHLEAPTQTNGTPEEIGRAHV